MRNLLFILLSFSIMSTTTAQEHTVTVKKGDTTLDIFSDSPGPALKIEKTSNINSFGAALRIINHTHGSALQVSGDIASTIARFTALEGGTAVEGTSNDLNNSFVNFGGVFTSSGNVGNGVKGEIFGDGASTDPGREFGYGGYFFSNVDESGGVYGHGFNGVYGKSTENTIGGAGGFFEASAFGSAGVRAEGHTGVEAIGNLVGLRATAPTAARLEGEVHIFDDVEVFGDLGEPRVFQIDRGMKRVGIGSSNLTRELNIEDTDDNGDAIAEFSSSSGNLIIGMNLSGGGLIGTTTNKPLRIRTNNSNRMVIDESGNIGMGKGTADVRLDVSGSIRYTGTITDVSDMRFKKDIQPIDDALEKVLKLKGVTYYYRKDEFPEMSFNDEQQIGFVAQELEPHFPQLVKTDADGYKSVDYVSMSAVLVQAIIEQQETIKSLRSESQLLKRTQKEFESKVMVKMEHIEKSIQKM